MRHLNSGLKRPRNFRRTLLLVSIIMLSTLSVYVDNLSASEIFAKVPANLIPIFAKYRILPSDEISIRLTNPSYNLEQIPVSVHSNINGIKSIILLAAENEHPLIAVFNINRNPFRSLQTNIRLEKSGDIVALVDTGDQLYGNFIRVEARR